MTNFPGEAVLLETEYPGWWIDQSRILGSMGGSGEPDINGSAQAFILYMAARDGILFDQVRVHYDAVGPDTTESSSSSSASGTPGDIGDNEVLVDLYIIPKNTKLADGQVAANKIATQLSLVSRNPELAAFDLKTSLVKRRMSQGDRLVVVFNSTADIASSSSSPDLFADTTITNVTVSSLGRSQAN